MDRQNYTKQITIQHKIDRNKVHENGDFIEGFFENMQNYFTMK